MQDSYLRYLLLLFIEQLRQTRDMILQ